MDYKKYFLNDDFELLLELQPNGGFVFIHKNADVNDLRINKKISLLLAKKFGYKIEIREHKKKGKNPELLLNNELCDVKTPTKNNSIGNGFSHAQNQGINCFVSYLELNFTLADFEFGISNGFSKNKYINYVIFVNDNLAVKITREMYEQNVYLKELKVFLNEKG